MDAGGHAPEYTVVWSERELDPPGERGAEASMHVMGRSAGGALCAIVLVAGAVLVASCSHATSPAPPAPSPGVSSAATASATPTAPAGPDAIDGFDHPTNIVAADDGTGRIFVTDQTGIIRVVKDGALLPTPALDIRSRVGSLGNEQGLLGLAFPAGFGAKRYAYVYFTDTSGDSRVFRVHVSEGNPDLFDPKSMQLILTVQQPFPNHNGGQLAFGPDGYLYIGLGDGGSERDPGNRGQDLSTLLGKILRIDTESTPNAVGYRVPRDNPFVNRAGALHEIWAYGLRNPWRFSFDAVTGDLWIGDVGQDSWEEVDLLTPADGGANLGWSLYEGNHVFKATAKRPGFTWPIAEYSHSEGDAITGGYVYRGAAYPALRGTYVFGDFGSGRIWTLARSGGRWKRRLALKTDYAISTFGVDGMGSLWVADWKAGTIHRLGDLSH
jgi:glucose/arabinose dehydrogenase